MGRRISGERLEKSMDLGLEVDSSAAIETIAESDRCSRSERGAADEGEMRVDDEKLRFQID